MTVQEVYDLYLRYKKNLGDVSTELFLDWCDEVNRFAYRIMYGTDTGRFISTNSISVLSNDNDYTLPDDFLTMSPYGCGLYTVDSQGNVDYKLPITDYGSQQLGYYINGNTIYITPTPQSNFTIVQKYIPKISALDDFSDSLVVPDEFIYYVRDAIDCKYDAWDEDPNAEGLADQRFARSLDELARNIRKDTGVYSTNLLSGAFQ